jgi:hypothetical protein
MTLVSEGLRIIRERILISHTPTYHRDITVEITLSNESEGIIPSIFIERKKFMPGLKIMDETNQELVFYTNEYTRKLFEKVAKDDPSPDAEYKKVLENKESFVLWIRLPKEKIIQANEAKIIKLFYHDNSTPPTPGLIESIRSKYSLRNQRFLFSIPKFVDEYNKPSGKRHDIFYVVTVPEEYAIEYEAIRKHKILHEPNGSFCPTKRKEILLSNEDGLYENIYPHAISIRLPSVEEEVIFRPSYYVVPDKDQRYFFLRALCLLSGLALFSGLVASKTINADSISLVAPMYDNINAILGGIITASLAGFSLMKHSWTNRTRYWFILPVVISALGYLLKG